MKLNKRLLASLKLSAAAGFSIVFYSCATPVPAPSVSVPSVLAGPTVPSESARSANKTQAFIAPSVQSSAYKTTPVSQNRPGIATGWGEEIESNVATTYFNRSGTSPAALSSIYYNDKEGIKAMTSQWNRRGEGLQKAGNGLVEWGVKGTFGYLKNVESNGKRFVVGKKNRNYSLVVRNVAHSALEVVLSVDGLDILDGKPASIKKRGHIIQPGKTLVIKGFRKSEDAVAAFKFSSVNDSYTNLSQQGTRNVGVIGMAIYTQKGVSPWRYGSTEINHRQGARTFAEAPPVRAR